MKEELESKWNTKLPDLNAAFTKRSQEYSQMKEELESLKEERDRELEAARVASQDPSLTPEKREAAKKAIIDLIGFEPMNKAEFDQYYVQRRSAEMLIDDAQGVLEEAKELGKPSTTKEALIQHMQETGIKNPEKAYKDMFETELDKWKEEQLKKAKPTGFTTQTTSTAGGKQPQQTRPTKQNLDQLLEEALNR